MLDHCVDIPFLDQLSENVRKCLISKARIRESFRGSTITLQGETVESLKVVLSGWVKLYRISESGEEAILATLQAGQSFDEIAALRGAISSA